MSNENNKQAIFSWDSLTIYDGASSTASSWIGTYCGYSIPPSHASSNNEVLIHFYSDDHTTGGFSEAGFNGFKMEYNTIGKQITTIQNNTEYHINRCRILVTFFYFQVSLFFYV